MYIFHHECLLRLKKCTLSGHKFYMDREKVVCLRVARRFKPCWQKKHIPTNKVENTRAENKAVVNFILAKFDNFVARKLQSDICEGKTIY